AEGTFSAWLFAIARGKLKHEWRRRQRRIQPGNLEDIDLADPKTSSSQVILEEEELLLAGLRTLPDTQREALLLSVHSKMKSREIAETLGVSSNHLYVLIHRAREQLKQFFEKHS
ncbi:MAG: RNA polymerase sigma factor, partial [Opitutales bacterium]|nr:RNA polymerase sigma factor [Opitutales bacterium]